MALEPFTKRSSDNSTNSGFQFTFFCDICQQPYKSSFIQSKSAKKVGFMHGLAELASIGANLGAAQDPRISQTLRTEADQLMMRSQQQSGGMSASWHQEHDAALAAATNEAKGIFSHCPVCKRWVCKNDWDSSMSLCVPDASASKKNTGSPSTVSASTSNSFSAGPGVASAPSQAAQAAANTSATSTLAPQSSTTQDDPIRLLKLRLARGEITVDEFEKLKQVMSEQ